MVVPRAGLLLSPSSGTKPQISAVVHAPLPDCLCPGIAPVAGSVYAQGCGLHCHQLLQVISVNSLNIWGTIWGVGARFPSAQTLSPAAPPCAGCCTE